MTAAYGNILTTKIKHSNLASSVLFVFFKGRLHLFSWIFVDVYRTYILIKPPECTLGQWRAVSRPDPPPPPQPPTQLVQFRFVLAKVVSIINIFPQQPVR